MTTPSTMIGMISAGTASVLTRLIPFQERLTSSRGKLFRWAKKRTITIMNRLIITPAIMAPKKSLPTDSVAIKAKITIGILGGMIIPTVVAAAIRPAAVRIGYPFFSMAGIMTWPIDAASETDDPEMPLMIMLDNTLTKPRPPRNRPTKSMQKSISRFVNPPRFISWPITTNNGKASISGESIPEKTRAGSTEIKAG